LALQDLNNHLFSRVGLKILLDKFFASLANNGIIRVQRNVLIARTLARLNLEFVKPLRYLNQGTSVAGFPSVAKGNKIGEKAKRPMPGIPLDKKIIADLIPKTRGNVSQIADMMGTVRHAVRAVIDRDEELQRLLKDSRERQIDQLEDCVFDRAMEGQDTTLQLFLLKTQARHRGYDQSEAQHAAKDIATAAFDFILNKSKEKPTQ
jgi:hypothetical protein